jgi:aryl-alcohol dehydrogenase (NADP+)
MQNHYNLIYREEEREMIPQCMDQGVGLIPWSPLARGFLAGNRNKQNAGGETVRAKTDDYAQKLYYQDDDFAVAERLAEVAKARGLSNTQVALAWMLAKPGITAPIIGASKMHHLNEAISSLDVTLSDEEIKKLEEPYKPHVILGHS